MSPTVNQSSTPPPIVELTVERLMAVLAGLPGVTVVHVLDTDGVEWPATRLICSLHPSPGWVVIS